jgi:hypothetical protein
MGIADLRIRKGLVPSLSVVQGAVGGQAYMAPLARWLSSFPASHLDGHPHLSKIIRCLTVVINNSSFLGQMILLEKYGIMEQEARSCSHRTLVSPLPYETELQTS